MPQRRSEVWKHFSDTSDGRAICSHCCQVLSHNGGATGNLIRHMKKKHQAISIGGRYTPTECNQVFIEEVNVNDTAHEDHELTDDTETITETITKKTISDEPKPKIFRSFLKRGSFQDSIDKTQKRLVVRLTREEIELAAAQKDIMEKELEEKSLKVLLLEEEIEHKRQIYELEKQEMKHKEQEMEHKKEEIEHKRQMQELAKEEMLLKIELLKSDLANRTTQSTKRSLPSID